MKKSLIVIAALILAMSVAGCGKKAENTNTTPQQTAQSDASGAYENGSATETLDGQDYSKNVDMAAVEGTEAKSDTKADSYSGEVSNNDISIEEAKLINYDDSDVVVVSFEFTNKTDSDQSFSGVFKRFNMNCRVKFAWLEFNILHNLCQRFRRLFKMFLRQILTIRTVIRYRLMCFTK